MKHELNCPAPDKRKLSGLGGGKNRFREEGEYWDINGGPNRGTACPDY